MAYSGITATEAEIDQKSGANVSTAYTDTMKTQALLQAESYLNAISGFNWSDWYALTPNVDVKYSVTMYTASWVASEAINYDVDAVGRGAANLMLNKLANDMRQALETLKDKSDNQQWIRDNA